MSLLTACYDAKSFKKIGNEARISMKTKGQHETARYEAGISMKTKQISPKLPECYGKER